MKKKKLLAIFTAAAMVFGLAGCSGDEAAQGNPGDASRPSAAETVNRTENGTAETGVPGAEDAGSAGLEATDSDAAGGEAPQTSADDKGAEEIVDSSKKNETFTLMFYMVGSNLESDYGCATADINEVLYGYTGDKVNIVFETGGAYDWQNSVVAPGVVQKYAVEDGELVLKEDLGKKNMAVPNTLADFITWSVAEKPADRYGLILWNHGGGTIGGFGHDEIFDEMLTLSQMDDAFEKADVNFEFIGFDACLMSTIETGMMLSDHANYMIASEEIEPGTGWYYTNWIKALCENPSMDIKEIAGNIIDDYVDGPDTFYSDDLTLAVTDLSKIPALYKTLCEFLVNADSELHQNGFIDLSMARSNARDFGDGDFDQIDIVDFAQKSGVPGYNKITQAVDEAVLTFGTNMNSTSGLAMYFPYEYPESYDSVVNDMKHVGFATDDYSFFFNDFVSLMVNGHTESGGPLGGLVDYSDYEYEDIDYSDTTWYQEEWEDYEYFGLSDDVFTEYGELYMAEKGDDYVLSMSEDDWSIITSIETQAYWDDGEGYIFLGSDNVYQFDKDGDLLMDFDYTWVALDGQIVTFFAIEEGDRPDGSWYSYGYVPAELTTADGVTKDVELMVYWDSERPNGYVKGYRIAADEDSTLTVANKNLAQLQDGDVLDFWCEYYTYDGEYEDWYYFGDSLVVDGELIVSYEELVDDPMDVCFYLKDIYNNSYWTETITYY